MWVEPPVPVWVRIDGQSRPGFVAASRGRFRYVRYWTGPGLQHLAWVDDEQVQEREGP